MMSDRNVWWRKSEKQWPTPIKYAFWGMLLGTGITLPKAGFAAFMFGATAAVFGFIFGAIYEPIALALRERAYRRRIGKAGFTELMYAAAVGDLGTVVSQLAKGVNINSQDHIGASALMYAASGDSAEIVRILLNSGADMYLKTKQGNTALSLAIKNGSEEIIDVLNQQSKKPK
jgi:hypothetical protein